MTVREPDRNRIAAFDSLRFLAALAVLLSHFAPMFGPPFLQKVSKWGICNSKSAVAFFFVLSGYVLHLSWRGSPPTFTSSLQFWIRRCLRIYPLYYLSLALSAAALLLPLASVRQFGADEVIAEVLSQNHANLGQWLHHLLLLSPGLDFNFINPPIWTLAVEMRIALLFPAISWALFQLSAKVNWGLLLAGAVLFPITGYYTIPTLAMVPLFMAGAMIAQQGPGVSARWGWPLFAIAVLGYSQSAFLAQKLELPSSLKLYPAGIFSGLLLVTIRNIPALRAALARCVPPPLANSAYGVYVLHFPIILLAGGFSVIFAVGIEWAAMAGVACTILMAVICYYILEYPMIKLGRTLASLLEKPRRPASDARASSPQA